MYIAPLRLSHRRNHRLLRLYPPVTRVDLVESPLHGRGGLGYRIERVIRRPGADCRGVDLQGE